MKEKKIKNLDGWIAAIIEIVEKEIYEKFCIFFLCEKDCKNSIKLVSFNRDW